MPSTALKISSPKHQWKISSTQEELCWEKSWERPREGFKASSEHRAETNTEASAGAPTTEKGDTIKVTS